MQECSLLPTGNTTVKPADFAEIQEYESLCISGSVASTYCDLVILGINLNQQREIEEEEAPTHDTVIPTANGIYVNINKLTVPVRLQIQGPTEDPDDRWCADITTTGGVTIPYSIFNTECWNNGGTYYNNQLLAQIILVIPGDNDRELTFYDLCLIELEER